MLHPPSTLLAVCLALGPALAGCASEHSSPPAREGVPVRIRVASHTSDQAFEIVNETHTDPVELYSSARASAETKVQTDEVVGAILEHFDELGFYEHASPGLAPRAGDGGYVRVIEVLEPGRELHMGIGPASPAEEQRIFNECFASFLAVYNETYQLQAVERHPGWSPKVDRPRR